MQAESIEILVTDSISNTNINCSARKLHFLEWPLVAGKNYFGLYAYFLTT